MPRGPIRTAEEAQPLRSRTKLQIQAQTPWTVGGVDFACAVGRLALDHRAEDVVVLDLGGICSIADFFVIATGASDRQLRAIADHIETYGRTVGQIPYGISGYESASWILLDYVDVVIHLFTPDRRRYYDLELLWGDARRVELKS